MLRRWANKAVWRFAYQLEDFGAACKRAAWKLEGFSFKRRKPYDGPHVTLADLVKNGGCQYQQDCVDIMMETNEILADLSWKEEKHGPD